jgi:hypothetical protein
MVIDNFSVNDLSLLPFPEPVQEGELAGSGVIVLSNVLVSRSSGRV